MRLTSPRWASAVKDATGRTQHRATLQWLHSLDSHDRRRRDVISPELCNDALNLLRPSLPPPSTCDVIEINPGAGIWSQQLHEVLKPRRHVFVEPEYHNYKEALSPLLEQSGSAYRLAPHILDALDETQDFLSPQLRDRYASLDAAGRAAASRTSTSQLIIVANLTQKTVRSNGFQGPMSKLFMEHFYRNLAMGTGAFPWHKYGLARLLAWIPEIDKSLNPRCTSFRFRAVRQLEASCQITEIVSSFPKDGRRSFINPWYGAALESARNAAAKDSSRAASIPEDRRQPLPMPPSIYLAPVEKNFPLFQSIQDRPPLVDQYIKAYKAIKTSDPNWLDAFLENPLFLLSNRIADKEDPRWIFSRLHVRMKTTHGRYAKVDELARDTVELDRRLIAHRQNHPGEMAGYRDLLQSLQGKFEALRERFNGFFKDNRHAAWKAIDDYRAFNHKPYLLNWNNRSFEPLLCHPKTDFFPHQPMSLLEFTPNADFVATFNTADRQIVLDYILHRFDLTRTQTVKKTLEDLVGSGEAYDNFVGKFGESGGIPSLTDPLQGGMHDLEAFRLRTLSTKQLNDIALAYEAWPWRVSVSDMIEAVSTNGAGRRVL